ncbi:MAG: isoleucine--tRNA ligase [Prevotellaceae bacterium]|jgi:isoleucyl-tRNA synthetase|nr:isoleucine--tRNA ligase [Prevotellaceae bacterium]
MAKKFAEYDKFNLAQVNEEVLKKWDDNQVFAKSVTEREGCPAFVFYEGPPSANGMPGIHHVMARTIKDIFCRYKTMTGHLVKRKAGWDTHGLPVELGVEKSLGITKEDIGKTISVVDYNAACRKDVMKFTKEWEDLTHRMGYWVDMKHPYITYDNRYIETLWWLLKQLYKKGLLYKGYTIQPYSPAAGTGLSSHELNQPGCYRDVKDMTCVAMFHHRRRPEQNDEAFASYRNYELYLLAWTTTPWTLPSNTALCVGPNIVYNVVKMKNPYGDNQILVILAKDLLPAFFGEKKIAEYEVVGECKGKELEGMEYEQLIPWIKPNGDAFRVVTGDFVTTEDGTGIVHIAPTFGADDKRVGETNGIVPLTVVDKNGIRQPMVDRTGKFYRLEDLDPTFVNEYVDAREYEQYAGRFVKNDYAPTLTDKDVTLDIDICTWLYQHHSLFKKEKHVHNYPHCWRTDKPVLYYPLDSWFIRSTACKERMIALNKTIRWKPENTGTGRFGKWLENLNDWNLSRSRYWGTPLPIWRTDDSREEICIESVEELYREIDRAVAAGVMKANPYRESGFVPGVYTDENYNKIDLHRPYVDDIVLVSPSGKPMKRETDLIDVWFDSGAMPYAQVHYPFENKEAIDSHSMFPADFIAEGVDQTRGWFFTLHAIAAMVFDNVSYKAVVSNGLVLDKNGVKMSKRLGNAVDPFTTIDKYGSDPLRWYMITNTSPWDNLKFDTEGVEEVRRKFFGTLYNTYSFFALYANVDGFEYKEADVPVNERPEIDCWILSVLNTLIKEVDACYNDYEPTKAGRLITDFVNDNLSNWYVRLNRKRFWGGDFSQDKLSAYQTLYCCLETVARLMAPIAPFYADKLYMDLIRVTGRDTVVSVHLAAFPQSNPEMIDADLEARMKLAQDITSMVLALRRKVGIKVRQPLQCIMIPVFDAQQRAHIEAVQPLIMSEVNVKEIKFVEGASEVLVKKVKCDFKKMGPKFGKRMKVVAALVAGLPQTAIAELEQKGSYTIHSDEGWDATIEAADVEIFSEDIPGWLVANEGKLTVALEVTITEELRREGIARELVNRIQNIRKANGYEITDKIHITLSKNPHTDDAVREYNAYICNQVLGMSLTLEDEIPNGTELTFDEYTLRVNVSKNESH